MTAIETSRAEAAPPSTLPPTESGLDLARATHANLQEMVKVADAKAAVLATLQTFMLGALLALPGELHELTVALAVSFCCCTAFSLVCAVLVLKPRFPRFETPWGARGFLWVDAITSRPHDSYVEELRATSGAQLLADLAFENSKIASLLKTKFLWLQRSTTALACAVAPLVLVVIPSLIGKVRHVVESR